MDRPWPLTGRDAEQRALTTATRPGAAGILLAGPAGVGKTRLAREALSGRAGVAWAHGSTAARPFPLGAFAGVLEAAPGGAPDVVAQALADLAGATVIAVDDAHLLDELSALVLHRVVSSGLAPVVVTVRTEAVAPDPVTALWKDDLLPRIDLAPLDAEDTAALVAHVLQGPVESRSADRLWTLTEGSPLFLRHLLAGEVDAGRFSPASGLWRWTDEPSISPRLSTLLEQQMGDLAPDVQEVVDLVALAEPVTLGRLTGLTSGLAVEAAEEHGLVRVEGDSVRLAHPLYGEVRRAGMGRLRARRLRGRVAQALSTEEDPIQRAVLLLDSDQPPEPALFLDAAQAAIRLYDLPLAERLAGAAGPGFEARLTHAAALSWLSRGEEAEAVLVDLARTAPPGMPAAVVHLHRTGNLLWTLARPEEARATLALAQAQAPDADMVRAMGAALAASLGGLSAALERGVPALDAEEELPRLMAAHAVAAVAAVTGRLDLLERAAEAGGITGDRVPTGIPAFGLADWVILGFRLAGLPDRAADVAARMRKASRDLPGPARLMGLVLVGHAALARGRVTEAVDTLREAWAGLAVSGHEFAFRCRTLLAQATALAGRPEPELVEALATQHPAYRLHLPDDLLARAWASAAGGAVTEAVRAAAEAADLAREQGWPAWEALAGQVVTQLGGEAHPLGTGPRGGAAVVHAEALAADDADALLDASARWERLGDLVAACDAAAQAAEGYRRRDRQGSALTATARAQELAARSGCRTPALVVAARPLPLTAREREIVELAARGLSNRDIAERLVVSVRTVEGHLYRAGMKLGVSDRKALADVVGSE